MQTTRGIAPDSTPSGLREHQFISHHIGPARRDHQSQRLSSGSSVLSPQSTIEETVTVIIHTVISQARRRPGRSEQESAPRQARSVLPSALHSLDSLSTSHTTTTPIFAQSQSTFTTSHASSQLGHSKSPPLPAATTHFLPEKSFIHPPWLSPRPVIHHCTTVCNQADPTRLSLIPYPSTACSRLQ